jgi:L-amino acid N-acyltransferase YncA
VELRIEAVEDAAEAGVWLEVRNAVALESMTESELARLDEMAPDMTLLIARDGDRVVGAGAVWSEFDGRAAAGVSCLVLGSERRRGVGAAIYRDLSRRAAERGRSELQGIIPAEDTESLGLVLAHGFRETTRSQRATLELTEAPAARSSPDGVTVVALAERPDVEHGMYEVAREAWADIPIDEPPEAGSEAEWRRKDLALARPELSVAALAGDEVVGYATVGDFGEGAALHLMTGVRRAWRGRGVARALKEAAIERARTAGLRQLVAFNDATNVPMQRLNVALGFELHPVYVVVRGPLAPGVSADSTASRPASS